MGKNWDKKINGQNHSERTPTGTKPVGIKNESDVLWKKTEWEFLLKIVNVGYKPSRESSHQSSVTAVYLFTLLFSKIAFRSFTIHNPTVSTG